LLLLAADGRAQGRRPIGRMTPFGQGVVVFPTSNPLFPNQVGLLPFGPGAVGFPARQQPLTTFAQGIKYVPTFPGALYPRYTATPIQSLNSFVPPNTFAFSATWLPQGNFQSTLQTGSPFASTPGLNLFPSTPVLTNSSFALNPVINPWFPQGSLQ